MNDKYKNLLLYLSLAVVPAIVFSYSCTFTFLSSWDDNFFITDNTERLTFTISNLYYWLTHKCIDNYLPLTMFSYMIDYQIWGLNPLGYHLQNVFWHIITVFAVYKCLSAFGLNRSISFFTAMFFAVHPQRVESVVWLAERKDVLCAALYFLSFYCYMRQTPEKKRPIAALVLFILALMAKPMAISLPAVLFFYEIHCRKSFALKPILPKLWPFIIISAVFLPITILTRQYFVTSNSIFFKQMFAVFHNVPWYIMKTFVPTELCPIYAKVSFTPILSIQILSLYAILLTLFFICLRLDRKLCIYTIIPLSMSYLAALLPVAGFLPLGGIDYADRYSYITSFFILATSVFFIKMLMEQKNILQKILTDLFSNKALTMLSASIIIASCALTSVFYSTIWGDMYSICRTAANHPNPNPLPVLTLGHMELGRENYAEVFKIAGKLSQLKGKFQLIQSKHLQALALYRQGEKNKALPLFEEVKPCIKSNTYDTQENYKTLLSSMADCYASAQLNEKAAACYTEILENMQCTELEKNFYAGLRCVSEGNIKEALFFMEKALNESPDNQKIKRIISILHNTD